MVNLEENKRLIKPKVIIYKDYLLGYSETFILEQGESIQKFVVYYAGSRLVTGLSTPKDRTIVINHNSVYGKVAEGFFKVWGVAPQFYRRVRQLQPLLVHAHFGADGVLGLYLAQSIGIPLVVTFHGYDATIKDEYAKHSFYIYRKFLKQREKLKRDARLFIAVSKFIKDKMIEKGFPAEKIVVHYIGVNVDKFEPDPKIQRDPIVLFVGRLVEKKGCKYLIEAMAKVQKAMPDIELMIIGDGPLRSPLETLARKSLKRYQFLGVQPSENVKNWLNRARIFSVPSVTAESGDSEGFGMVFIEAQAMGLPVVSFACGGIPEAVAHGETGLLATEGDSETLAVYILHLLEDEKLWHHFSHNGQTRVRTMFNLNKQARSLEKIYDDILKGHP